MKNLILATGFVMASIPSVSSADVLMTFEFGIAENDGGTPLDGTYGGSLELIVYGVNAVGDMDGTYDVELYVDYNDFYDPIGWPLVYEGTAIANRSYQDDMMDIFDMGINFDVGGTTFPYSGVSFISFADMVTLDPSDPDDIYSYGLPSWSSYGDDGSGGLFYIDYSSLTETIIPAPSALAMMTLAGLLGSGRRRR
ncbi:MAG: hypothetical protein MK089_11985 [Phycisphaerales bacterium]|nr:hypothetical protein [Phycisphaerales bacterium]